MTCGRNYSTLSNLLYVASVLVFNEGFIVVFVVVSALSSAFHSRDILPIGIVSLMCRNIDFWQTACTARAQP